jgi:hypothetical protein
MPIATSGNCTVSWGSPVSTKADIARASFNLSQSSIDVTAIDSSHMKYLSGIVEGTADIEMFFSCAAHGVGTITPGTKIANLTLTWTGGSIVFPFAIVETSVPDVAPNGAFTVRMSARNCDDEPTITCT